MHYKLFIIESGWQTEDENGVVVYMALNRECLLPLDTWSNLKCAQGLCLLSSRFYTLCKIYVIDHC